MPTWEKLGLLYRPDLFHPKLISHAANPLAVWLERDLFRIYFSGRDAQQRSSVGAVDIDLVRREVVGIHQEPLFPFGPTGSYYESGVSIGNCYTVGSQQYMLFMGWRAPPESHWFGEIGRIRVDSDGSLTACDDGPLLGLDPQDPVSLSYPWVMQLPDRGYQMWYGSTISWDAGNGEMLHVIKHATSEDGHSWDRHGISVPYETGIAQAFSRPTVRYVPSAGYQMWFSYRSGTGTRYRIGYARSDDGQQFELDLDRAGIDVSDSGWDSEMIEYPFVFAHGGQWYMLYNGNAYGKTGFGLALLKSD